MVSGNDANTAAARPLGNMIVIKFSYSCSSDFTAANLTTTKRIPRKVTDNDKPKITEK